VLALAGVRVTLGGQAILDGVSLRLRPGGWYGLLGPNGCGKTTLMRVALGLLRPAAGLVSLCGQQPPGRPGTVAASFGPRLLHPRRRAWTEVSLRVRALGGDRRAVHAAWEETGLADTRVRCGDLSLGQAQRLAVVCALAGAPRLVVLDEPTVGLDAAALPWLRERLAAFVAGGGCAWVSSHDLAEVERCADQVTVLHAGRVAYDGPVSTLTGADDALRLRSSQPDLLRTVLVEAGLPHQRYSDGSATVFGRTAVEVGRLLAARSVPLVSMYEERRSLDSSLRDLLAQPVVVPETATPGPAEPMERRTVSAVPGR
jgi:ABC-2 type transport system ATP-binding protein